MRTITAGGVRLECRWWGEPDRAAPTLVLLHEGLGCVATWRDFPALLHRRTGLPVFAYSRAGYGGSDPAELPRGIDYMHVEGREVVGAVLDAAGIGDAVLVGHSDGASIAIVHAGAIVHTREPAGGGPPHARALVSYGAPARAGGPDDGVAASGHEAGTPARADDPSPPRARALARPVPRLGGERTAPPRVRALVLLAPHVFCEDVSVESIRAAGDAYRRGGLRERLARHHGDRVDATFFGWHDAWLRPAFRQWSIEAFLPGIAAPVLLIQGDRDAYGTPAQLEAIERGVPGPVTRAWLEDCGHAPHRERPAETLDAIEAFLAAAVPDA